MNFESALVTIVFLGTLTWVAIASTLPDSIREPRKLFTPLALAFLGCFAASSLVARILPDLFQASLWLTITMWAVALAGIISLVRKPDCGRTLYALPRRGRIELILMLLVLGMMTAVELLWSQLAHRQDWAWLAGLNVIGAAIIKMKAGRREICEKGVLLRKEQLIEWGEFASFEWLGGTPEMLRLRFRETKKHGIDLRFACPQDPVLRKILEGHDVRCATAAAVATETPTPVAV